jgi:FMN phosphatase YigB (HAD superfamily)
MLNERQELSSIENELLFKQWRLNNKVDLFLLDGDGTIWDTGEVFRQQQSKCYGFLAKNAGFLTEQQWENIITEEDNLAFEKFAVDFSRWSYVFDKIAQKTGLSRKIRDEAETIIMQIYQTPLKFLDRTKEGLKFLNDTKTPFGIVTHANRHWTWQKYQWSNLAEYLDWDMVYTVDENTHKTSSSWLKAVKYFGSSPERCAVVGDSPRADINPAYQIGVEHCFLIQNSEEVWSVHQQPVDPKTTIISSVGDLIWLGSN